MKTWLSIIGIILFIASMIIGALQHSEVQYQIGLYYKNKNNKAFADWYFTAGARGHEKAKKEILNSFSLGTVNPEYSLQYIRWFIEDRKKTFDINKILKESYLTNDLRCIIGVIYFDGNLSQKQDKVKGCAWARSALISTKKNKTFSSRINSYCLWLSRSWKRCC